MDEASRRIAEKAQALSDVELAVLLCLVAEQHCIIEAEKEALNSLEEELQLVASNVFGLTCSILNCSDSTTVDDFGSGILVQEETEDYFDSKNGKLRDHHRSSYAESPRPSDRRASKSPRLFTPLESRRISNVVIARNLNEASHQVQIQSLELIRGKRNFTRTAVHAAPRPFVFIALNVTGAERLTIHLNDQFFISHKHHLGDEFPNLEDYKTNDAVSDDNASTSSVVHTSPLLLNKSKHLPITISNEELQTLSRLTAQVRISTEIRAYLHNIVVFMRLHRAVAGGISALATRHFTSLVQALAPLHGLTYVSPSLVALAARKIYPHRIVITSPEDERSMQWGSSLEAVRAVLEGVTVEDVIEEVLQSVETPL